MNIRIAYHIRGRARNSRKLKKIFLSVLVSILSNIFLIVFFFWWLGENGILRRSSIWFVLNLYLQIHFGPRCWIFLLFKWQKKPSCIFMRVRRKDFFCLLQKLEFLAPTLLRNLISGTVTYQGRIIIIMVLIDMKQLVPFYRYLSDCM